MSRRSNHKSKRVPQHVAIIILLIGAVGISGLALLLSRSEHKVEAEMIPRAARIERVEGNVGVARGLDDEAAQLAWDEATINAPLSVGDRIYAQEGSRASVAFTGRNSASLNPGTSLDVLSLADRRTQLALRSGSAIFDLGHLDSDEMFEIATPNGAIDLEEPGLYQVGIDEGGSTLVTVLSGLAQVVGLAASGEVSRGELLTLAGMTAAQALLSKVSPDLAGGMVDDYYGYRYPDEYDGRYSDYNYYLDDPYYYDPYRQSASYRYVPTHDVPGLYDLDDYGDWREVEGYGHCWSPRVEPGWAPYRNGSWIVDDIYGPTWVSQEPWGWTPYHYGRWANVSNQWVWVPQQVATRPVYSPALVAFIPNISTNQIGWVPLAPGESYLPRYYDSGYTPRYYADAEEVRRLEVAHQAYANLYIPEAVTVVPMPQFTSVVQPVAASRYNTQWIAEAQPVLDPYSIEALRQSTMSVRERRRKMKMSRSINEEAFNRPVYITETPVVPPDRADLIEAFQVSQVSKKEAKRQRKLERSQQVVATVDQNGLPVAAASPIEAQAREQRKAEKMAARAARGQQGQVVIPSGQGDAPHRWTDDLRKQRKAERKLERQQAQAQQAGQPGGQQAAVDTSRQQRKELKRQERQRQAVSPQQSVTQPSVKNQAPQMRKAAKRGERSQQAAVEQAAKQAQFGQQAREQRRAQKQAARAERARQQSVVVAQPNYQQKKAVVIQQGEKDRQQRKAERRSARQQAAQQPVYVPQPSRQAPVYQPQARPERVERKAERRAAKQQAAQQPVYTPQPAQQAPVQQPQARPDKADRRAEKAQRKAERGKQ